MELKQKLIEKMQQDRERARKQRMAIEKMDNEEGFDGESRVVGGEHASVMCTSACVLQRRRKRK